MRGLRTILGRSVLAGLLGGALALSAAAAGAGVQPNLDAKVAKHESGPFKDSIAIDVAPSTAKNVYLKVRNRTDDSKAVELSQFDAEIGWDSRYFKGQKNVSDDVHGDGYEFLLKAGKAKFFRVRIKAPPSPDSTCVTPAVIELGPDKDAAIITVNEGLICIAPF